jgi:copper chaperone CopZ
MRTTQLKVDGMNCASCVAAVRRLLSRFPEVDSVDVDLPSGVARMTTQEAAVVSMPDVLDALAVAGYPARPLPVAVRAVEQPGPAQDHTCGCERTGVDARGGGSCCG